MVISTLPRLYHYCKECDYYFLKKCNKHFSFHNSKRHCVRAGLWHGKIGKFIHNSFNKEINAIYIDPDSFSIFGLEYGSLVFMEMEGFTIFGHIYPLPTAYLGEVEFFHLFSQIFDLKNDTFITLSKAPLIPLSINLFLKPLDSSSDEISDKITSKMLNGLVLKNDQKIKIPLNGSIFSFNVSSINNIDQFDYLMNDVSQISINENSRMNDRLADACFKINLKTKIIFEKSHKNLIKNILSPNSNNFESDFIVGVDNHIEFLKECKCHNFINNDVFKIIDASPFNGIILYGPPGCGKSSIVFKFCCLNSLKCFYFDCNFTKNFSDFLIEMTEKFDHEKIDVILLSNIQNCWEKDFFILLNILNSSKHDILVVATAPDSSSLPNWIHSSKFFEKQREISLPNVEQRKLIVSSLLKKHPHDLTTNEYQIIADKSCGYTPQDLKILIKQVAIQASLRIIEFKGSNDICIKFCDFLMPLADIRPSYLHEDYIDIPKITWSDIGGQQFVKLQVRELIEFPSKFPGLFEKNGLNSPSGVLLYGPPGNSKTMIARAVANVSGLTFFSVRGPELLNCYVGKTEEKLRNLFSRARASSPSVIFFDEIDSFLSPITNVSSSGVNRLALAQLLSEMDGICGRPRQVLIIGATNRPHLIDPALLRRGRFDRLIYVPLPDSDSREEILTLKISKMDVDESVDIKYLVNVTDGYSGAELVGLCEEAFMCALRQQQGTPVRNKHFSMAISGIKPRTTKDSLHIYEDFRNTFGCLF